MEASRLQEYIAKLGITLSDTQAEQFLSYYALLLEWNSYMNLTAITAPEEVLIKHFADSLAAMPYLHTAQQLLDVGTGAGFPAIPLKIAYPSLRVTMIDSLQKRVRFLEEVITQLKLPDITALHGRAEDFAKAAAHREQYDIVVSRAVAHMAALAEYCLPYVRPGGYFLAYKATEYREGSEPTEAARAIQLLGGETEAIEQYQLPETTLDRCLVRIKKVTPTPGKYPRKAGTAAKNPL